MRDSRVRSRSPRCNRARLLRTCAWRLLGPPARDRENTVAGTSVRPPSPIDAAGKMPHGLVHQSSAQRTPTPRKRHQGRWASGVTGERLRAAMQQWPTGNPRSIIPARTIAAIYRRPLRSVLADVSAPAFVGRLPGDAHGFADVRPRCPGGLRGRDGFVQAAAGLGVFALATCRQRLRLVRCGCAIRLGWRSRLSGSGQRARQGRRSQAA